MHFYKELLVHRNTVRRDGKTPAERLMGRTLRCPFIAEYSPMENLWYKPHKKAEPRVVRYLFRKGANTAMVAHEDGRTVVAHDAQLSRRASAEAMIDSRTAEEERPSDRSREVGLSECDSRHPSANDASEETAWADEPRKDGTPEAVGDQENAIRERPWQNTRLTDFYRNPVFH